MKLQRFEVMLTTHSPRGDNVQVSLEAQATADGPWVTWVDAARLLERVEKAEAKAVTLERQVDYWQHMAEAGDAGAAFGRERDEARATARRHLDRVHELEVEAEHHQGWQWERDDAFTALRAELARLTSEREGLKDLLAIMFSATERDGRMAEIGERIRAALAEGEGGEEDQ